MNPRCSFTETPPLDPPNSKLSIPTSGQSLRCQARVFRGPGTTHPGSAGNGAGGLQHAKHTLCHGEALALAGLLPPSAALHPEGMATSDLGQVSSPFNQPEQVPGFL